MRANLSFLSSLLVIIPLAISGPIPQSLDDGLNRRANPDSYTLLPPITNTASQPDATPAPSPKVQAVPNAAPASGSKFNYRNTVLAHHNVHRANHSAPDLTWSADLANIAKEIAVNCSFKHVMGVDGINYGQNIAAGIPKTSVARVISDLFYNREMPFYAKLYGQAKPDMSNFGNWGHFSQIVWKNTYAVGCFTQYCSAGLANVGGNVPPWFTVCNYQGPGNVAGRYADNIGRPLGDPIVTGDDKI